MSAFFYTIALQWKMDFRKKELLLVYYLVPLVFFAFMGGIFTSIMPQSKETLIQSMTIFGVSMGAFIGSPSPISQIYGSETKNAYRVGRIPLWTVVVCNFISAFVHLYIMSLIIFLLSPVIFKATIPENLTLYFFMLALFITVCIAIGTVFGVFIKNTSKLTMFSQLAFLPSIMLSGIMFPASMLPEPINLLGKIFPATWGYMAMCELSFKWYYTWPLLCILSSMLVLIIIKVVKLTNDKE